MIKFVEIIYLLRKYNKEVSENAYKIDEQVQGMHDKVSAAHMMFLDYQLRVVDDETADHE